MSRYDYYDYFEPTQPIRTDKGIKAKSKRGEFAKNWWATRWIAALEKLLDRGRLSRGRSYARQGQVLSRTVLAEQVWDMNFDSDTNVVEVAIRRLRAKLDDPFPRKLLHTVRGMGYVLEQRAPAAGEAT